MKIKWFGHSCFLITSENGTKIFTDPYNKIAGYKLPKIEADIVSVSHNHSDHNNINAVSGKYVHINKPGSFLENGIEIKGIETFHDNASGAKRGKNIIYCFNIDGLRVCHCGDLGHTLSSDKIEEIGHTDILLLPVGGLFTINGVNAAIVMKQLDPTIVVPMHYRTKALGLMGYVFDRVDKFVAASGMQAKEYAELDVDKENINDYAGIDILKYY